MNQGDAEENRNRVSFVWEVVTEHKSHDCRQEKNLLTVIHEPVKTAPA